MTYNIPYNYVLIRPEEDNSEWNGMLLGDSQLNNNVFGEILAVPRNLRFEKRRGSRSEREKELFQRKNAASVEYGTEIEVKKGDIVVFYQHSGRERVLGGLLLMPYDQLVCKVGENLVPLNGNVLVEVEETVMDGQKGAVTNGEGVVYAVGKRNSGYMFSDRRDLFDPKVGDGVYFKPSAGYPLEVEAHRRLPRLVSLFRKDIYLTYEN